MEFFFVMQYVNLYFVKGHWLMLTNKYISQNSNMGLNSLLFILKCLGNLMSVSSN